MRDYIDAGILDAVFGPTVGDSPEVRARVSKRHFVRGMDQLTFDDSPRARGRRLTAREALAAYGFDVLAEVATEGSALLCEAPDAIGQAIRQRREQLGLDLAVLARRTDVPRERIEAMEQSRRLPLRDYERVARALGLDERMISFRSEPSGNDRLAVRLRSLRDEGSRLSQGTVAALAEAAWVAMAQVRLEDALGLNHPVHRFTPLAFFGSATHPAFRVGYDLANQFRATLGVGDDPLPSMRALVEETLCTPVIQTNLSEQIAGATIDVGGRRAIVLNRVGRNANVFVRRATLAHEVCHLLFDPTEALRELRVDAYRELDAAPNAIADRVEQRANAFAVQMLAPQDAALRLYNQSPDDPLGAVLQHFGISFTAGRYQIWNARLRAVPLAQLDTSATQPAADWEGRESYTIDYHPVRALAAHPSRAGRFSAVALRGAEDGLISWDTAAEWLFCTEDELHGAAERIRALYPLVFSP